MSDYVLNIQVNQQQLEALITNLNRTRAAADRVGGSLRQAGNIDLTRGRGEIDRLRQSLRDAQNATSGLAGAAGTLKSAFAGLAIGAVIQEAVSQLMNAQREFDKLHTSLVTMTGSTKAAGEAYKVLQEFAASTPYSLNEVTNAFITLKARGLDPSEKALRSYGDTAAGLGKPLQSVIEAVADAVNGDFERTKEAFNVKASKMGSQVAMTFKGITTMVQNNAEEIEKYLIGIGEVNFAGGMERQSKTLDGALSNLGDTWNELLMTVNKNGVGDAMQASVLAASSALKDFGAMIDAVGGKLDEEGKQVSANSDLHNALSFTFKALTYSGTLVYGVLKAIGIEIKTVAMQAVALANLDWEGFKAIGQEGTKGMVGSITGIWDDWQKIDGAPAAARAKAEADKKANAGKTNAAMQRESLTPEQRKMQSEQEMVAIRMKQAGVNNDYLDTLDKLQEALKNGAITEKVYVDQVSALAKTTYESSTVGKEAAKSATEAKQARAKGAREAQKQEETAFKNALDAQRTNIELEDSLNKQRESKLKRQYATGLIDQQEFITAMSFSKDEELQNNIAHNAKAIEIARARGDAGKAELDRLLADEKKFNIEREIMQDEAVAELSAYAARVRAIQNEIYKDGGRARDDSRTAWKRANDWTTPRGQAADDARIEDMQTAGQRKVDDLRDNMRGQGYDSNAIKVAVEAQEQVNTQLVEIERAGIAERIAMQADWKNGAISGMNEYMENAKNVAGQTESMFANAAKGMEDALVNFAMTGKLNFADLAKAMIADMVRIQMQAAVSGIFKMGMMAFGGSGEAGSVANELFADGGVIEGGVKQKFASGGVVHSPKIFKMANGAGMMGEAGPEGVLPLKRMANGNLGVQSQGAGGGGGVVNNYVTVTVEGGKTNDETGDKVAQATLKMMEKIANQQIAVQQRPFGLLNSGSKAY